jgi:putative membrane protein
MGSEALGAARETTPAERRRLHPASLLFSIGRTLRALLFPALVALLSGSETFWAIVGLVMGVPAIGLAIVRHLTLRWSLRPEELFVEEGLWFRSERHVPYARIQDVDLVQGPVHRLLGVAEVRVQTAGGSEPEAVLRVLGLPDVEVLRAAIRAPGRDPGHAPDPSPVHGSAAPRDEASPPEAPHVLVEGIPLGRLVALGLVLHRGLAVVGAGFVLLVEADLLQPLVERLPLAPWLAGWVERPGGPFLLVLVLLVGGLAAFALLSIAWSVVRFGGYRLERIGEVLHVRCGLLTRVLASVPLARIQSLTVEETWMHRLFGCATLVARTAGATAGEDDPSAALRHRFVPIVPVSEVPALATSLLPGTSLEGLTWHPLGPGAAGRAARRAVLLLLLVVSPLLGVVLWSLRERAALPALLVLVFLAAVLGSLAALAVRRTRWARTPWGFVFQRGVLTRRTTLLPADRIQTVRTAQSPFDRRRDHATLTLDAAGGARHASEVRTRYMAVDQARAVHDGLASAAAATEYRSRACLPAAGARDVGGRA